MTRHTDLARVHAANDADTLALYQHTDETWDFYEVSQPEHRLTTRCFVSRAHAIAWANGDERRLIAFDRACAAGNIDVARSLLRALAGILTRDTYADCRDTLAAVTRKATTNDCPNPHDLQRLSAPQSHRSAVVSLL